MEDPRLIRQLRSMLELPLPGRAFQYRMAHTTRRSTLTPPMRSDVRHAAVLILLFRKELNWFTVLIKRRTILGDVHSGQISFPGGRMHTGEIPEETAVREAFEEIGSPPEYIKPLGRLTSLYIPVSNHLVFPVVAFLQEPYAWTPQESEVEQVLEMPLMPLTASDARILTNIDLGSGQTLKEVPSFYYGGHIVWGATAMILGEFIEVLERMKSKPEIRQQRDRGPESP